MLKNVNKIPAGPTRDKILKAIQVYKMMTTGKGGNMTMMKTAPNMTLRMNKNWSNVKMNSSMGNWSKSQQMTY